MSSLGIESDGDRVRKHTSEDVNRRIDQQTRERIERTSRASPVEIGRRLAELDREWDIDRAVMANFAIVGGTALTLGIRNIRPSKKGNGWLYLFGTQMGFLLYHAIAGWCPPVAVFRRLGFRTQKEICRERQALEALIDTETQTGTTPR